MQNMMIQKIKLTNDDFHHKIACRFDDISISTAKFTPILSKKRISSQRRWFELLYRKYNSTIKQLTKITNLSTINTSKYVKQIENIILNLNFLFNQYESFLSSRTEILADYKRTDALKNNKLKTTTIEQFIDYVLQMPIINHVSSFKRAKIEENVENSGKSISNNIIRNTAFHPILNQEITPKEQNIVLNPIHFPKKFTSTSFGKFWIKERELSVTNLQTITFKQISQGLSYGKLSSRMVESSHISPHLDFKDRQISLKAPKMKKKPIYLSFPEIKHINSQMPEVIKEKVIEKNKNSKSLHEAPEPPDIDVNRIADEVYSVIERKIKIEKERRGLFG